MIKCGFNIMTKCGVMSNDLYFVKKHNGVDNKNRFNTNLEYSI